VATAPVAEGETVLAVPWAHAIHVFEDGHDVGDDGGEQLYE
jgi:hypothetical protein